MIQLGQLCCHLAALPKCGSEDMGSVVLRAWQRVILSLSLWPDPRCRRMQVLFMPFGTDGPIQVPMVQSWILRRPLT